MNRREIIARLFGGAAAGVAGAAGVALPLPDQDLQAEFVPNFTPEEIGEDQYADLLFTRQEITKPLSLEGRGPEFKPTSDTVEMNWSKDGHLWATLRHGGDIVSQRKLI